MTQRERELFNFALDHNKKLCELLRIQRKIEHRVSSLGTPDALALLRAIEGHL